MDKNRPTETPLTCDITAIAPDQRARHQATTRHVFAAVQARQELTDGYAFRFAADSELLLQIAEFISLERLCCPFFHFTLEVEPEGGPVWLKLTGPAGVKQFLLTEIGLDKPFS